MSAEYTSIAVYGASGRTGSRVVALALDDPSTTLVHALTRRDSSRLGASVRSARGREAIVKTAENAGEIGVFDVLVCFASADGITEAIALARSAGAALLVGTTALSKDHTDALREFSTIRAVLVAPNTSLGVCVLADAVARAASMLGHDFECSIVEAHHSRKLDAPSGTALRLAHAVRAAGHPLRDDQVLAVRGGDVVGEHTVRFAGPGEYLEFTHRATTRDVFAAGAIRAARWLKGRAPGWYTVNDVLGIGAGSPQIGTDRR
jgi:4-hydroxy-tetrahydrodipicolinate reductase